MVWFAVWTVLVAGTLVGAFFLGRDLWRKAGALLAELGRAADVLGRVAAEAGERAEKRAQGRPAIRPQVLDDRAALRGRVDELRRDRAVRAAARSARHTETYARWRALSR